MLLSTTGRAALLAAVLTLAAHAAEDVTAVQQALRDQQFYFGQITGQLDELTQAALRRYQIHSGLPVSSQIDAATLEALRAGAPPRAEEAPGAPPAEERSVRGRSREVEQEDREFLDTTPPAPAGETAPPEPAPREPAGPLSAEDARRFVQDYLVAAEGPSPAAEVGYYASRVEYFDSGTVDRSFIEKDQRAYYRRWPDRDFDLVGDPEIVSAAPGSATVRYRLRFAVRREGDVKKGETENLIRLVQTRDGLKIASIRERKVRR